MNAARPAIDHVFDEALARPAGDERNCYLDATCGDDAPLRRRVEQLLRAHAAAANFLESPAVDLDAVAAERSLDISDTHISRYKLLEQIGEGGMGVVYVAEQTEPVRRKVALKIIKPGMDTRQVIARFEAERQALAMMDHPNIAKVLDGGAVGVQASAWEASGTKADTLQRDLQLSRPYFVMELVRGMPITDYCDQAQVDVRGRLTMFATVCQAVQHAHQKGIIHRDIKPNNVLVTMHDSRPVVKVIDFGVAKAVNQNLTEQTIYTAFTELIGTPLYMSPEQAELSGLDIDTRTDVYSLGVLLYELLTGRTPFDRETLVKVGLDEIRRMIREDEPPRPSHRISTLKAEAGSTVSQRRGIDLRQLTRALHGELDWIVMKALEKERNRRYDSASSLADDIQRYLSDLPILARAPSPWLRLNKWRRRHPRLAISMVMIALLLVLLGAGDHWHRRQLADALAVSNELRSAGLVREQALRRELLNNDLIAARQAAITGDTEEAVRLIELHAPNDAAEDCGFAWRFVKGLCLQPTRTLVGHKADILTADASPDSQFVASGDKEGAIKIWGLSSGQEIKTLQYDTREICAVRFSPDGRLLATAGQDSSVRLWDVATWTEVARLSQHDATVCSVCWSPDSNWLVSSGRDMQVNVWDVRSRKLHRTLETHDDIVRVVIWSPDGKWLASADGSFGMKMFDTSTWKHVRTTSPLKQGEAILAAAFSPSGRYLAYGGYASVVRVFDLQTRTEIEHMTFPRQVWSMTYAPIDQLIAGGFDGGVQLLDVGDARRRLIPRRDGIGESGTLRAVILADEGKTLITVSQQERTIKTWNYARVKGFQFAEFEEKVNGVLASQDLVVGSHSATPRQLNVRSLGDGTLRATLPTVPDSAAPAYCDRRNLLAVVEADGQVRLWDTNRWSPVRRLRCVRSKFSQLQFAADGEWLAASCENDVIGVWRIDTGQWKELPGRTTNLGVKLAVSPTEPLLAASNDGPSIQLWRFGQVEPVAEFGAGDIHSLAISPDGNTLAAADSKRAITLWRIPTGESLGALSGHAGPFYKVAFAPDGSTLVSSSGDGTVRLWNVASRRALFPIAELDYLANWLGFLSDGRVAVIREYQRDLYILGQPQN